VEDASVPCLQRTNEIRLLPPHSPLPFHSLALTLQQFVDYADLKNAGKGTGGSCTAAIFLKVHRDRAHCFLVNPLIPKKRNSFLCQDGHIWILREFLTTKAIKLTCPRYLLSSFVFPLPKLFCNIRLGYEWPACASIDRVGQQQLAHINYCLLASERNGNRLIDNSLFINK